MKTIAADERLLYRMNEAAEVLGISRAKCYELAAQGVIPTVRLPAAPGRDQGSIRVPVAGLRAWIERQLANQRGPEAA